MVSASTVLAAVCATPPSTIIRRSPSLDFQYGPSEKTTASRRWTSQPLEKGFLLCLRDQAPAIYPVEKLRMLDSCLNHKDL